MPTPEDEFLPRPELITRAVGEGLAPYVYELETGLARALPATVTVWVLDRPAEDRAIASVLMPDALPMGEIRLRFRRTFRGDRVLAFAEAHYPPVPDAPEIPELPKGGSGRWCGFLWAAEVLGFPPQEEIRQHHTWIDRMLYEAAPWRTWDWK